MNFENAKSLQQSIQTVIHVGYKSEANSTRLKKIKSRVPFAMSKLTVMKYNQIMMAVVGIYPHSFKAPPLNWLQSLSPYLMAISLITCDLFAAMYAYQETQLSLMLEAVLLVIGGSQSLAAYFNMKWKMDSAGQVNSKLQEIVQQGINTRQKKISIWDFIAMFFSYRT